MGNTKIILEVVMKRTFSLLLIVLLAACSQRNNITPADARFALKGPDASPAQATYDDIQKTIGVVPSFLRGYPEASIAGAWNETKAIQLSPTTAISPKDKELIGLAVASQIPCTYCTQFHTEAAKLNGGTDQELKEAVAVASCARHWSTVLNGSQTDEKAFRKDVDKIIGKFEKAAADAKKQPAQRQAAAQTQSPITTADAAYKDIEATLGVVPGFVKQFPEEGIVGAWQDLKSLELNPNTALSDKQKNLIALAVSAQIPCAYCTYMDTKFAKLSGATDQEIKEAVAMAAITRKWSTVLNGLQTDQESFSKEVKAIVSYVKQQQEVQEKKKNSK